MLIGALRVHPTFYPAVQTLKAALYLLNQYVYYHSLTYLYKIVTMTLIGASLTSMLLHRARFTSVVHPAPHENHLAEFTTGLLLKEHHIQCSFNSKKTESICS